MVSFSMETVFIAMSGGFDSSFAAYVLKRQGFNVVGVTFRLLPDSVQSPADDTGPVARARKTADLLSIPHHVYDFRKEFLRHVIEPFVEEYRRGRTPNPCVLCNTHIKFGVFAEKAFASGADRIATGHYARVDSFNGIVSISKGVDKAKDQSYFLYGLRQPVLSRTLFPLGAFTKKELKSQSAGMSWDIHRTRESQDVCFIQDGDYRAFLDAHIQRSEGPVCHVSGTCLGRHNGIHLYTIGQRRGINIPFSEALYVIETVVENNSVIVGGKADLQKHTISATPINMFSVRSGEAKAKVRYRQQEVQCVFEVTGDILHVEFIEPIQSAAPGQSIVLYNGDTLLGGGVIQKTY